MENNILNAYKNWMAEDEATVEDFNEWLREAEATEIDRVINDTAGINFEYCTWFCDANSDDIVIQLSVDLKGGYALVTDSYCSTPFSTLEECADFLEKTNKRLESFRISNYTDVAGEETQIIIDHNKI
jgi:hypothetical protein